MTTLETLAFIAGADAFKRGLPCSPGDDQRCFDLKREGNPSGTVGNPITLAILKAWHRGWHEQNAGVPYVDISNIQEYGLTQKLTQSIRVF